jgi:apolipoprotein N-acyltransferase
LLEVFAQWVMGNPYDIGGALGRSLAVLLISFLIAYLVRGRKSNWDSFARWYFWLVLLLLALSSAHPG